jgi:hypothetical protein
MPSAQSEAIRDLEADGPTRTRRLHKYQRQRITRYDVRDFWGSRSSLGPSGSEVSGRPARPCSMSARNRSSTAPQAGHIIQSLSGGRKGLGRRRLKKTVAAWTSAG